MTIRKILGIGSMLSTGLFAGFTSCHPHGHHMKHRFYKWASAFTGQKHHWEEAGGSAADVCQECLDGGSDYCISGNKCVPRATYSCEGPDDHITGDVWFAFHGNPRANHSMSCPKTDVRFPCKRMKQLCSPGSLQTSQAACDALEDACHEKWVKRCDENHCPKWKWFSRWCWHKQNVCGHNPCNTLKECQSDLSAKCIYAKKQCHLKLARNAVPVPEQTDRVPQQLSVLFVA